MKSITKSKQLVLSAFSLMSSMTKSNGKIIIIFNPEKYKEVLSEYQPKLIKTEVENERALVMVEQLMNLPNRSLEQEAIYELLIILY